MEEHHSPIVRATLPRTMAGTGGGGDKKLRMENEHGVPENAMSMPWGKQRNVRRQESTQIGTELQDGHGLPDYAVRARASIRNVPFEQAPVDCWLLRGLACQARGLCGTCYRM